MSSKGTVKCGMSLGAGAASIKAFEAEVEARGVVLEGQGSAYEGPVLKRAEFDGK